MYVVNDYHWQIGRLADWQIGRLADWQIGRLADWQIGRLADWQIGKLANWQIGKLVKLRKKDFLQWEICRKIKCKSNVRIIFV